MYLVTFPESREKRKDKRNPGNLETFEKTTSLSPRIFLPVCNFRAEAAPKIESTPTISDPLPSWHGKDAAGLALDRWRGRFPDPRVGSSIEIATNDSVRSCPGESTNPSSKTPFDEGQAAADASKRR